MREFGRKPGADSLSSLGITEGIAHWNLSPEQLTEKTIQLGQGTLTGTGALAAMAGTALVIGAAFVDPSWARTSYLALASFHIYLELVVLAVLFVHRPLIARTRVAAQGVS